MINFSKQVSIRWSDLDPNFHLRHSSYYDFGSQHRIELLEQSGLTLTKMKELNLGPVLFREECVFKREIFLSDVVTINTRISELLPDASRWSIQHQFVNQKEILCAVITVDGAWIDTKIRKLANPIPPFVLEVMESFPKSENFKLI